MEGIVQLLNSFVFFISHAERQRNQRVETSLNKLIRRWQTSSENRTKKCCRYHTNRHNLAVTVGIWKRGNMTSPRLLRAFGEWRLLEKKTKKQKTLMQTVRGVELTVTKSEFHTTSWLVRLFVATERTWRIARSAVSTERTKLLHTTKV